MVDRVAGGRTEPELAFELLRRVWRQGYATEASLAVLEWARSSGYERLWATVWVRTSVGHRLGLEHCFSQSAGQGRVHRDRS
ncbi:GNAT family N-acetyltransferase [Streptomyces sp. NPDC006477]|uniref:GNAT family N-acetyltransferase n=1 Tax=Streptomyces sp. NPDC006477 TaxID=3364747 RepID=UPI00369B802D